MSRPAISKIIRTEHQNSHLYCNHEQKCHLYCIACRLVLLSHFDITTLFKNHILFILLAIHWRIKFRFPPALTLKDFFQTFRCIITPISGIIYHYCIMEKNFKKIGENKSKLRKIYPNNHENFKNKKSRVQFYWLV